MNLMKVVDALTEDLDPASKARVMFVVSSVAAAAQDATKGVDTDRVGQLVGHYGGRNLMLNLLFRRAMRRAGLGQYASIGSALGYGAQIVAANFEIGRSYTRQHRAEMEAAGVTVGTPKRKTQPKPPPPR